MPTQLLFENEPCSRCGGSGQYSFNSVDGSRCYGCNGAGNKLTKRGRAAQEYLNDLRKVPAEEVKVGDLLLFDFHFYSFYAYVETVTTTDSGHIEFVGTRKANGEKHRMSYKSGMRVQRGWSADEKAAHREQALAYQATLTKAGTPRKKG